jgi:hypothetical protein
LGVCVGGLEKKTLDFEEEEERDVDVAGLAEEEYVE